MKEVQAIVDEAARAINAAQDLLILDQIKAHYLGKKGSLTEHLKGLSALPANERPQAGQLVNQAKQQIETLLQQRHQALQQTELQNQLTRAAVDVTASGRGQIIGSKHPITLIRERMETFFTRLGFTLAEGPEIENDYYNFEALNMPSHHPARDNHDTFYFPGGMLLRTHTSPVQIRSMEGNQPPMRILAIGRVYRCDSDVRHTPMFHQAEGLLVGENVTFAHLKSLLQDFLEYIFDCNDLAVRFRPSYFPFTEPSAEVDIQCCGCQGAGCRICSDTGWLEILGSGMIHPNVLAAVNIDSEQYSGFAFGIGLERLAMLRFAFPDIRILYENDLRMLKQF